MSTKGRQATAVAVTGTGAISAVPKVLYGFSLRNTSGGAAVFRIYDNASAASGTILVTLNLDTLQHVNVSIPGGLSAAAGLYFESGGAIEGSAWVGPPPGA